MRQHRAGGLCGRSSDDHYCEFGDLLRLHFDPLGGHMRRKRQLAAGGELCASQAPRAQEGVGGGAPQTGQTLEADSRSRS